MILKLICVNCNNLFEIDNNPFRTKWEKCPKCGSTRLWKDNEKTRKILLEKE